MNEQSQRASVLDSMAAKVALGSWLGDHVTPWWMALTAGPKVQVSASLVGAVHLMAQTKSARDDVQREALGRLMAEVVDDFCSADRTRQGPPPPSWGELVYQLAVLADGYPEGSLLRDATVDLSRRVLARMRELDAAH